MRRHPRRALHLLLAVVPSIVACASPTAPELVGAWGGADASLTLTRAGGEISYACGQGTIDPGWTLSPDGVFAGTGQHFMGGGPVPAGGRPPTPARYTGRLEGSVLTLEVTLPDLDETLGPFRLVRGGPTVSEICV